MSATVFTLMNKEGGTTQLTEGLVSWAGRQDNISTREAALAAMGATLLLLVLALIVIVMTIPASNSEQEEAG